MCECLTYEDGSRYLCGVCGPMQDEMMRDIERELTELRKREEVYCDETGANAINGACPVHHGDACLLTPEGFVEVVRATEREAQEAREVAGYLTGSSVVPERLMEYARAQVERAERAEAELGEARQLLREVMRMRFDAENERCALEVSLNDAKEELREAREALRRILDLPASWGQAKIEAVVKAHNIAVRFLQNEEYHRDGDVRADVDALLELAYPEERTE